MDNKLVSSKDIHVIVDEIWDEISREFSLTPFQTNKGREWVHLSVDSSDYENTKIQLRAQLSLAQQMSQLRVSFLNRKDKP